MKHGQSYSVSKGDGYYSRHCYLQQVVSMTSKYLFVRYPLLLCWIVTLLLLSGVSMAQDEDENRDPIEGLNRAVFKFNDKFDQYLLKPVAKGYQAVLPRILNDGVTNFFNNLNDVVVIANGLLQGKFEQAAMDTSRVVYNTTFGVLGFFDVASHMDLPKHNEDFGQTLAVWGVPEGGYLVLPFLGPSTFRDAPGLVVDWFVLSPIRWFNPTLRDRVIALAVRGVDTRAGLLRVERALDDAALDRYIFFREAFLQRRLNLIYDGNPPQPEFEEGFEDLELFEDLDEELDESPAQPNPATPKANPSVSP